MFAALKALFQAAQTLFMSADTLAQAVNEVSTWCKEEAEGFNEKARLERNQTLTQIRAKYKVENLRSDQEIARVTQEINAEA